MQSWSPFAAFLPGNARNRRNLPLLWLRVRETSMTDSIVPHFHNDIGVPLIDIGAKKFMCIGALPPFDHPHVYCDMGAESEHVCPYCSTLYRYDPKLPPHGARPAECALHETAG